MPVNNLGKQHAHTGQHVHFTSFEWRGVMYVLEKNRACGGDLTNEPEVVHPRGHHYPSAPYRAGSTQAGTTHLMYSLTCTPCKKVSSVL